MAHGVELEISECDALHLAVGGMVVDPVLVAAEAVARMQHRRMLVGDPREFVQPSAGERAEPVEMRLRDARNRRAQIERQQRAQAAVDGIKILSRAVRRDVLGAAAPGRVSSRMICRMEAHPWSHL